MLALAVSIVSLGISLWISNRDWNRAVRAQMNALIPEITAARQFGQINISLAMQAVALIEQKPKLMNANDYLETAGLLFLASDWTTAKRYFETAIEKSANETDFVKIVCRRAYANSLFRQHDYEKGRRYYRDALNIVSNETDLNRTLNAFTHLMWYQEESTHVLNGTSAEEKYRETKSMYEKVSDFTSRQRGLDTLEEAREQYQIPIPVQASGT